MELELAQFFAIHFHFRTMCSDSDSDATEMKVTPPLADSVATNVYGGYQSVAEMGHHQNRSGEQPSEVALANT